MAQLDLLRKKCENLGLEPEQTRNRVEKDAEGKVIRRYKESTIDSCKEALQNYYIEKYRVEGTLNPFVERILKFKPMLASQMKTIKEDVLSRNIEEEEKIDFSNLNLDSFTDDEIRIIEELRGIIEDEELNEDVVFKDIEISYNSRIALYEKDSINPGSLRTCIRLSSSGGSILRL